MESVFRILGPLEVERDGRAVLLGGRRERAILAILLLNVGEVVSVERLIDGLWGEARPSSAKHMVHEYVSRLRTALVEVAPIATRPPGYMLKTTKPTEGLEPSTPALRERCSTSRATSAHKAGESRWLHHSDITSHSRCVPGPAWLSQVNRRNRASCATRVPFGHPNRPLAERLKEMTNDTKAGRANRDDVRVVGSIEPPRVRDSSSGARMG
jgi:DNA-binding winged helix-turn-helix (wHTH) protein